jgi:transposase
MIGDQSWSDSTRTPERMKHIPYEVRDSPIRDLMKATSALRAQKKRKGKLKLKFKCRKDAASSITLRARQLNCKTARSSIWPSLFGTIKDRSVMRTEKGGILPSIFKHDARLIYERKTDFYFLCIPIVTKVSRPETQGPTNPVAMGTKTEKKPVIAIDPGVRTFATCYDPCGCVVEWSHSKSPHLLYWLQRKATRLEKRAELATGRRKRRLSAAAARIRSRSVDLVNELHRKLTLWLCREYKTILLPKFATREIIRHCSPNGDRRRKIGRKTAGELVRQAHYRFRMHLQHKAAELGATVILCKESYTSMTCGKCGKLNRSLGGQKCFQCPYCKCEMDRDHNGARNILLRYISYESVNQGAQMRLGERELIPQ